MNFPYPCLVCPMKFQNERDLKMHSQVHSRSADEYFRKYKNWISNTDMLFQEMDTMFFVNNMYHFDKSDVLAAYDNILHVSYKENSTKKSISGKDSNYDILNDEKVPNNASLMGGMQCDVFMNKKNARKIKNVKITPKENLFKNSAGRNRLLYNVRNKILMSLKGRKTVEHQENTNTQYVNDSILTPLLNVDPILLQAFVPNQEIKNNVEPSTATRNEPIKIKIRRKPPRMNRRRVKSHGCDKCCKNFASFGRLVTHRQKHAEDKVHECYLCHRKFDFLYKLKRHMGVHITGERHECELCKKTYRSVTKFKRHRCIKNKRPHSCPTCKRTFTRINYLNFHKRCHKNSTNLGDLQTLTQEDSEGLQVRESFNDSPVVVNEAEVVTL